jgi:hypothetical protein
VSSMVASVDLRTDMADRSRQGTVPSQWAPVAAASTSSLCGRWFVKSPVRKRVSHAWFADTTPSSSNHMQARAAASRQQGSSFTVQHAAASCSTTSSRQRHEGMHESFLADAATSLSGQSSSPQTNTRSANKKSKKKSKKRGGH